MNESMLNENHQQQQQQQENHLSGGIKAKDAEHVSYRAGGYDSSGGSVSHNPANFRSTAPPSSSSSFYSSAGSEVVEPSQQQQRKKHDSSQSFDISDVRNRSGRKNIHVKSRSGDSDFLYTDFIRSSVLSSGKTTRQAAKKSSSSRCKASTPVSRASSFHYANQKVQHAEMPSCHSHHSVPVQQHDESQQLLDSLQQHHQRYQHAKNKEIISNDQIMEANQGVRNQKYGHDADIIQRLAPTTNSTAAAADMSNTPTGNKPTSFHRNQQQSMNSMIQNAYYQQSHNNNNGGQHDSPNQSFSGGQQQSSRQTVQMYTAALLHGTGGGEIGLASDYQQVGAEVLPQRPNTLALGQNTRKATDCTSNTNDLVSPSSRNLPSPSLSGHLQQCTPLRTPMYAYTPGGSIDKTQAGYSTSTGRVQHPRQKSGGSISGSQMSSAQQQYLRRNGSSGNIVNSASTGASTPSCNNAATFAADYNSFCETINMLTPTASHQNQFNTHNNNQQQSTLQQQQQMQAFEHNYPIGIGKGGDTSSSSQRTRLPNSTISQYRNSGSFGYSSAGSGSSSNSGSRPNSHAEDFPHLMEIENDNLRCQLKKLKQQLLAMQNIKKTLQRITDDYNCLHQTATKREKLHNEMQKSLMNDLQVLKSENGALKNKLNQTQEQLYNNQLQTSNHVTTDDFEAEKQKIINTYEEKNCQLEESNRQLAEELDECRERMSEQSSEIEELSVEVKDQQEVISKLKEQLQHQNDFAKSRLEQQKRTSRAQHYDQQQANQQQQQNNRHQPRFISPHCVNDEGIFDLEQAIDGFSLPTPTTSAHKNESYVAASTVEKAKQWPAQFEQQQRTGINSTLTNENCPRCHVEGEYEYRYKPTTINHRHAISDPLYNNFSDFCFAAESGNAKSVSPPLSHGDESSDRCVASGTPIFSYQPRADVQQHHEKQLSQDCQDREVSTSSRQPSPLIGVAKASATTTTCNQHQQKQGGEGESPASEGYHSQHSSGSPTPNNEGSASNFSAFRDAPHPESSRASG